MAFGLDTGPDNVVTIKVIGVGGGGRGSGRAVLHGGHNLLHDLLHQKFLIHKTCCLLYWNETVTACGFLLLSTSSVSLMWSRADSA